MDFPHSSPDTIQRDVAARRAQEEGVGSEKHSKDEVNYRAAGGSKTRCGTCAYFTPGLSGQNGACSLVSGIIASTAVCDLWTPKSKSMKDLVPGA